MQKGFIKVLFKCLLVIAFWQPIKAEIDTTKTMLFGEGMTIDEVFQEAQYLKSEGIYLGAIKRYTYCLLVADDQDLLLQGNCYKELSDLYWRNGNNTKALEAGIQSLELFEQLDNKELQIEAAHKLIQIYIGEGDYSRSEQLQVKAKELIKEKPNKAYLAENIRLQAVLSFYKEQYDSAILLFKQSKAIHKALNDDIEFSIDLGNIAESYEKLNRIDSALLFYNKALTIQRDKNFISGLIFIHYGMGSAYFKQRNYDRAISSYRESIKLMEQSQEKRELSYVLGMLAEVYAQTHQYELAYVYQKKQSTTSDSILFIEKNKRFDQLKAEYQVEKAWKENDFLRKENNLKSEQLKDSQRVIWLQKVVLAFIILGLLLSIIYTVVFFNNQRRLKLANNTRDKLFSIIGHDLRGPIGSAKGVVDLLLDYDPANDSEKVNNYLHLMSKSLDTTYNLLEELLSWAKSQAHSLKLNPVNVELKLLIEATIKYLEPVSNQKKIQVINYIDSETTVYVDSAMITTVIRNLLSNAIKFSQLGDRIEIAGQIRHLLFEVTIKDYGVGIEESNIEKLFNSNSFFTTYGTNNEEGTGLGLILCKEFVKHNGGDIWVESEVGKGSSFIFTMPLARIK